MVFQPAGANTWQGRIFIEVPEIDARYQEVGSVTAVITGPGTVRLTIVSNDGDRNVVNGTFTNSQIKIPNQTFTRR